MNTKDIRKIDGCWPTTIQIGRHLWKITPVSKPQIHVYPDTWETPLEDYVLVDHRKHEIGIIGEANPDTLAMVIACLVMGEKAGD